MRIFKLLLKCAGALVLALAAAALLFAVRPELYIRLLQKTGMVRGEVNSFEADAPSETLDLGNGIQLRTNIRYGETYPNSYLDIYRNLAADGLCPTFFYIHGGGYAWGDKVDGDPTAGHSDPAASTRYFQAVCASGYSVVSVNYALSPEYGYPTPVFQIDEAVRFLQTEQETYGLDLTHVVFSGGSAGGQLAGQYVNIQTDAAYAAGLGMVPALPQEALLGVVFSCALLEPENFGKTGDLFTDFMFSSLSRCYFGTDTEVLRQADVTANLSDGFPPVYLTDGNHATFDAQAERLDAALAERGISHVYYHVPPDTATLGHGYDSYLDEPFAQENLRNVLEFLQTLVSTSRRIG